jgi:hypothetical protein
MEIVSAPVTVNCKVEDSPAAMLLGFAVKLLITGSEPVVPPTVIVAEAVVRPLALVAVRV